MAIKQREDYVGSIHQQRLNARNYSALLVNLASQAALPTGVTMSVGPNVAYAQDARTLVDDKEWIIIDGGLITGCGDGIINMASVIEIATTATPSMAMDARRTASLKRAMAVTASRECSIVVGPETVKPALPANRCTTLILMGH